MVGVGTHYILFCLVLLAGDEIFMEKCGRFHFMKEHILSLAKQTGHTSTIYIANNIIVTS